MITMFALCGSRVTETRCLCWKDINWSKSEIIPNNAKRNTKKPLILHELLKQDLLKLKERMIAVFGTEGKYVFARTSINKNFVVPRVDSPMGSTALQRIVEKMGKNIGVDGLHCHAFRYGLATMLLESGLNVKDIQEIMRHKHSSVTLDIYIQPVKTKEKAKSVVDKFLED